MRTVNRSVREPDAHAVHLSVQLISAFFCRASRRSANPDKMLGERVWVP